jgi:uncharacterized protein YecE (DUF72 family)
VLALAPDPSDRHVMAKKPAPDAQLGLFGEAFAPSPKAEAAVRPRITEADRALVTRLPKNLRFGTSSWTFPGWGGVLYEGKPSQAALVADGLRGYSAHPLFRTVGIDRSHYAPLDDRTLEDYARGLPDDFRAVSKVWDDITTCVFPSHPRFGARAGQRNADFLSPDRFLDEVLAPYTRHFARSAGPFVFEIPPIPEGKIPPPEVFAGRIDTLLARLPRTFSYAFELRNPELLSGAYLEVLRAHGAAHVTNVWTAMPTLRKQLTVPGLVAQQPFFVARLMLPPYTRYEQRRASFEPFDRILEPQEDTRDDVLALVRAARGRDVYVLVNNKLEGSSPETVRALAAKVVEAGLGDG